MVHLKKYEKLLKEFGLLYKKIEEPRFLSRANILAGKLEAFQPVTVIQLGYGKVSGNWFAFDEFIFNSNGKFLEHVLVRKESRE